MEEAQATPDATPIMCGEFKKKGGSMWTVWQVRYFELKDYKLEYFTAKGGARKGDIDLRGAEITAADSKGIVVDRGGIHKKKEFEFGTTQERDVWLEALKEEASKERKWVEGTDSSGRGMMTRVWEGFTGNYTHLTDESKSFISRHKEEAEFVHGTLVIHIKEARNLPNMDAGGLDLTDAYVRILVDGKKGPKTDTIDNDLNPTWNETFNIPVAGNVGVLTCDVKDSDYLSPQSIGSVHVLCRDILTEKLVKPEWFPIKGGGELCLSVEYLSAEKTAEEMALVKNPFTLWEDCECKLYQNAHVLHDGDNLPKLDSYRGGAYQHGRCWEDMYTAIKEAQQFIYITGWSVDTNIKLLRERPMPGESSIPTLGEMLKQKAEEGVKVLVLIWDEVLSIDNKIINSIITATKSGMMSTHDEDTKRYFAKSKVKCQAVMRNGNGISGEGTRAAISSGLSFVGAQALFTHHQKTIILDTAAEGAQGARNRRVMAFVGGLDLTGGRWDCCSHPIFSTLKTWHGDDYYQSMPELDAERGPRQPWRDIHARVLGRVAHDVKDNFEQRWRRQAPTSWHKELFQDYSSFLEHRDDLVPGEHSWKCQLFRSIDKYSAEGVPGIERGIQEAYVHYIRRAKHFIFIENQYFLGSSKEWVGFDDKKYNIECKHHIPMELAAKIESKIRANERFVAYIIIPLYPEGPPGSGAVQAILHWQYKTIEFMYAKIGKALEDMGMTDSHPQDWLSFLTIGQREPGERDIGPPTDPLALTLYNSKRFMIYVHSKMMLVDDEFILVGSANINERSLAGDRDTEIAVGMMQPGYMATEAETAQGEIRDFRLSTWAEHMGEKNELFHKPQSIECVRHVNSLAKQCWAEYAGPNVTKMSAHIMQYPYKVEPNGTIQPIQTFFPDFEPQKAFIGGTPSSAIPSILTT